MGRISSYYEDKTLLITGGTGFLGKALLEKVLRLLPDVRRVVLLIRPGNGTGPAEDVCHRVEKEIFALPLFGRLRAAHGERFPAFVQEKVEVVAGDITQADLGLEAAVRDRLAGEVDVVINNAALVGFEEPLDRSVIANTLGPRRLLEFTARCAAPRLLHVSTAYVSGLQTGSVPETLPETRSPAERRAGRRGSFHLDAEIEAALRLARTLEEESRTPAVQRELRHRTRHRLLAGANHDPQRLEAEIEKLRRQWVNRQLAEAGSARARRHGWFDTYTFTKAMGEQLLARHSDGVPVVILRPSIIESSFAEPEPGWIEGFRMGDPILFGYGKGRVPDFPGRRDIAIDFIPVDFVVNAILASVAAEPSAGRPAVFHVASSGENPLLLGDCMDYCREYFRGAPMRGASGRPVLPEPWKFRPEDRFEAWLRRRSHSLETARGMLGRVSRLPAAARLRRELAAKLLHLKRLEDYCRLYGDYARLQCRFATDNTRRLFTSLPPEDRQDFGFDPTTIDWRRYICDVHMPGVRRHVMKNA